MTLPLGRNSLTRLKSGSLGMVPNPSTGNSPPPSGIVPIGGAGKCIWPTVWDAKANQCVSGTTGGETADQRCSRLKNGSIADQAEWQRTCGVASVVGDAVMGRYGAALQPGSMMIDRAVCLRGMQLGNDGLCYNKSQITNKQRMWPAGRKPLLTGGDMSAISKAARAGRRLEGATKRLQRMGMMRKPTRSAQRRLHPALKVPVHQVVDV